jgi:PAS domain S-box-containing protein
MGALEAFQFAREYLPLFLFFSVVINIAVVAFLGYTLGKDIGDRFMVLTDNVGRFRRQEKLNYLQDGTDELALLDQSFHEMASALSEAIARERDLIESAASIICAVNGEFILEAINAAAVEKLLGYRASDLIGTSLLQLLSPTDQELLVEKLYKVRYSGTDATLEVQLKTASGGTIESFWMIKWSKDKNTWICVVQDITERKLAEAMRRQMINMVSHDIRSPLATINVIFATLKSGGYGALSAKAMELTDSGERSCARLLTLTGDLLAVDRLESGLLVLEYDEVNIDNLLSSIVSGLAPVAERAKVMLRHQRSELAIMADRDRLEQILTNLVGNAIKFSNPGGTVYLHASAIGENEIEIVVKDQGIGIAEEHLPFIFDRYRQVRTTDATKKQGSGLGLTIAKALTELHAGTITCRSEVGRGTAFYVRLPVNG